MTTFYRRFPPRSCTIDELQELITQPSGGTYVLPSSACNEVYPGIVIGDAPTALCTRFLKEMGVTHVLNAAHGSLKCKYEGFVSTSDVYYKAAGINFKGISAIDSETFNLQRFFEEAAEFIDSALRERALDHEKLRNLGISHILNAAQGSDWERYVDTSNEYYQSKNLSVSYLGIEAMDLTAYQLHVYFDTATDFIEQALESNGKVLVHCREGISRSATLVLAFLMMRKGMTVQEAVKTVRAKREIIPNEGFLLQLCELNERLLQQRKNHIKTL